MIGFIVFLALAMIVVASYFVLRASGTVSENVDDVNDTSNGGATGDKSLDDSHRREV